MQIPHYRYVLQGGYIGTSTSAWISFQELTKIAKPACSIYNIVEMAVCTKWPGSTEGPARRPSEMKKKKREGGGGSNAGKCEQIANYRPHIEQNEACFLRTSDKLSSKFLKHLYAGGKSGEFDGDVVVNNSLSFFPFIFSFFITFFPTGKVAR